MGKGWQLIIILIYEPEDRLLSTSIGSSTSKETLQDMMDKVIAGVRDWWEAVVVWGQSRSESILVYRGRQAITFTWRKHPRRPGWACSIRRWRRRMSSWSTNVFAYRNYDLKSSESTYTALSVCYVGLVSSYESKVSLQVSRLLANGIWTSQGCYLLERDQA